MTASRNSHPMPRRNRVVLGFVAVVVSLPCLEGCSSRVPPIHFVLDPLPLATHPIASREDRAAAHLMEAALADNSGELKVGLEQVKMTGPALGALAQDVVNATLDDAVAYRAASQELLDQGGLHPLLESRLEAEVADDPVALAKKRVFDHRHALFARAFNAIVEPVATSLMTGTTIAPYRLALSLSAWALALWEADPLTLQERQALAHRKRYIAQHPDAANTLKIRRQIEAAEVDLAKTRERQFLYSAQLAMDSNQPGLAEYYAARALEEIPDNKRAETLRARAQRQLAAGRSRRATSVHWNRELPDDLAITPERLASQVLDPSLEASLSSLALFSPTTVRSVAELLLLPNSDLRAAAQSLRAADPGGELADEADFIEAIGEYESGFERMSWNSFDRIARRDPAESNMARHATALVYDARLNPYRSYVQEKKRSRKLFWSYHLLGNSAQIRRYKALPSVMGYVLAVPQVVQALASSPMRAIAGGKSPNFQRGPATAGYRYLERYPQGSQRDEIVHWLYEYEEDQENWRAALRLADAQPDFNLERRHELVEKTASQIAEHAATIQRRDQRGHLLRRAARDYPDSLAGHAAGETARLDLENDSAQRIRMTRGFLYENPAVADRRGLGVRGELLDKELKNGELHPEGISFLGGRSIEVALLNQDGDEDAEPIYHRQQISEERLARTVSMLDEMSIHNARIDHDYRVDPDAQRDVFFERARLGLTGVADRRALAQSTYVYKSMRERYGMVRSRDSLLPFDLVFRGSIGDLSLGAFPRWREPRQTPDSFLYRN